MANRLASRQFYFAYGSNTDGRQMVSRCPSARPICRARLRRWQLAFGGYSAAWRGAVADVVRNDRASVDGLLWEIDAGELRALDRYEGHPLVYERRQLLVTLPDGSRRAAFVYVQTRPAMIAARVSPEYYARLRVAYQRLGFKPKRLESARAKHDRQVEREAEDYRLVFVYGTLLTGEPNHRLLQHAMYQGEAETAPEYELYNLGAFPGMVPGGRVPVRGEVYRVDPITLEVLDRLEGHPNFYVRSVVRLADGRTVETYLLDRGQVSGRKRIASGDWREVAGVAQRRWEARYAS